MWKQKVIRASLIAQLVKNPPAMQETPVRFLGRSSGEGTGYPLQYSWAFLVAQLVKNLPAVWETWVRSLDWEDILEVGMATHSSIFAKRNPTDRGAWQTPWGCKDLDMTDQLSILGYVFETFLLELLLLYLTDFGVLCFHFLCLQVFFHFFFSFFNGSLIISNISFHLHICVLFAFFSSSWFIVSHIWVAKDSWYHFNFTRFTKASIWSVLETIHVHLKIMCTLLFLDENFCIYLLYLPCLMCHSLSLLWNISNHISDTLEDPTINELLSFSLC